jgi:hypothetical protein
MQNPLSDVAFARYSQASNNTERIHSPWPGFTNAAKRRIWRAFAPELLLEPAPNPVTVLWTACTRMKTRVLTIAYFPLTEKIEGVQQDRSLIAS